MSSGRSLSCLGNPTGFLVTRPPVGTQRPCDVIEGLVGGDSTGSSLSNEGKRTVGVDLSATARRDINVGSKLQTHRKRTDSSSRQRPHEAMRTAWNKLPLCGATAVRKLACSSQMSATLGLSRDCLCMTASAGDDVPNVDDEVCRYVIASWVSRVLYRTRHTIGHFGDESQASNCIGTDNQKRKKD